MKKIVVALTLFIAPLFAPLPSTVQLVRPAQAQSICSYIAYGVVLTAAQWNSCFQNKQDVLGTPVPLASGGTGASLTPSNGGIVYSTGSAFGVLAGTAAPSQCLLSGSNAAPTWGSCSGAAAVSSVTNLDGTLTISPNSGAVVASLALGNSNNWTAPQNFNSGDFALNGSSTGTTTVNANASSGTVTATLPANTGIIAELNYAQTWSAVQSFNSGDLALKGSSSGVTTLNANSASGTVTATLPANTGIIAELNYAQNYSAAQTGQIYASGYVNKFRNGTFDVWQRGTSALATATGGAYTADGWIVTQSGAAFTCSQQSGTPATTQAYWSLRCVGGASNTDTKVAQRIESYVAAPLAGNTVTVQFYYQQTSGSTITPKISTCYASAQDNFGTCTADLAASNLSACTTATWCLESYTLAASSSASNGYQVTFDCNTALTSAEYCYITAADIRVTPNVATGVNANPPPPELRPIQTELAECQRYYYQSLSGVADSATQPSGVSSLQFIEPFPQTMRATPSVTIASNLTNSNFTSGAPTGSQWTLSQANVGFPTKSGTASVSGGAVDANNWYIDVYVATFSTPVNILSSAVAPLFTATAEL